MRVLDISVLVIGLCACTPVNGGETGADTDRKDVGVEEVAMSVDTDDGIGDGTSGPMLQMMSYKEFSGAIEMGMGCSFVANNNVDPIFVATAEDSPEINGRAAIKINDHIVVLQSKGYGIQQVEKGGLFSNEAIEVTIDRPQMEPTSNGEASYYWSATLNIAQDEGGKNSYNGKYECGA